MPVKFWYLFSVDESLAKFIKKVLEGEDQSTTDLQLLNMNKLVSSPRCVIGLATDTKMQYLFARYLFEPTKLTDEAVEQILGSVTLPEFEVRNIEKFLDDHKGKMIVMMAFELLPGK